ncbi:MAG TPA: cation-transporting P-type ATPase, partial [Spirochaetia bacterium]|nr:cation-transporting P-type ATPase [Spirochaetia bacterium]
LIIGTTPLIGRFLHQLIHPANLPLWVAAVIGYLIGIDWLASIVVGVALLNAVSSFAREFKAERAVDALRNYIPPTSKVIRGGRERRINTENLVPGDIVLLDTGETIPADGRLIETKELRVDNSAFSGDPKPVYKSHDPVRNREQFLWMEVPALVFAGTTVIAGSGKAVVTSTGMDTEVGQIAYLTQTIQAEPSALQTEIRRLFRITSVATLILLAGTAMLLPLVGDLHRNTFTLTGAALAAVGIILGLTAEGLIPAITLVLMVTARRMRRRGALIKKLSSIETLGATDVICTDKTGTLTSSEMCVRKIWLGGRVIEVGGVGYTPEGDFREGNRSIAGIDLGNSDYRIFFYDAVLCNNSELISPGSTSAQWSIEGDPTEGALLSLVEKAGIDVSTIRSTYPALRRFPFDSIRKRMSTVHALEQGRGDRAVNHLLVKGAPHELLALCDRVLVEGRERAIDEELKLEIDRQIDSFAEEGMRILGFAYRKLSARQTERANVDEVEQQLVFSGLSAILDPPRKDAAEAIRICRAAGIRVIMITGEYQLTALSIARKLGIVERNDARVISGRELSDMNEEELRSLLETQEVVFARVNPEHRLRIVSALHQMRRTVAATGDGISDAPVLKKADIGVAMGRRGNPVTRATAEMVLSGDSFASIVASVEEGRAAFANIRRMVGHVSSHLLPQAFSFAVFLLFSVPLPLAFSLVLLIDLLIDLLPALAIGTHPPATRTMTVPPEPRSHRIVDRALLGRDFVKRGLIVTAVALGGYFLTLTRIGPFRLAYGSEPQTVFLLSLLAAQLALYISKNIEAGPIVGGIRRWLILIAAPVVSTGIVLLVVYLPGLNAVFRTTRPSGQDWAFVAVAFAVSYILVELIGLTVRAARRSRGRMRSGKEGNGDRTLR